MLKDKPIGLLAGGKSAEREISLKSAKNVKVALENLGYRVIMLDLDDHLLKIIRENDIRHVYNILHGKYGEDGCVQGFFEINGINYTGSGVLSSSICMDKNITKKILIDANLPVSPGFLIDFNTNIDTLKIDYPIILKPLEEGSSIDVSIVKDHDELKLYLREILPKYRRILAEKYIKGKELTVGIIGTDIPKALPILELIPKNTFYDFDAKYTPGKTEFVIPARISDKARKNIKEIALKAHKVCQCYGVSRIDIMLDNKDNPYILEINTSPGMTEQSDLPAQAKAAGISMEELVMIILRSSFERK
ncbi:MAG: D-alanine--D-alanine ligase [Candidatus Muiribacterium halophilum]|uniref:D-alanine--D-alanine ligase n=1 Tax=Muiribacterium halophilum TaxID=2053465 RepID=A0A2N5ZC09_MUIH1|nr:MAG: D-alanine--D-alanine ligase [Candidatus Muirbacterium halophilum]